MKKVLFYCLFILFSCNNRTEYKNNLNQLKSLIEDINDCFIDSTQACFEISDYYTNDFIFHSYPAGNKKGIETDRFEYIQTFNEMKRMNMSINIGHSIYLPGIDKETHQLDGSVRVYYGATISIDTINVDFSAYQTVDFRDGRISEIWEWADYGGVSNQLNESNIEID